MPRFTLIVLPTGKVVIASEEHLSDDELAKIQTGWEKAQSDPDGLTILRDCRVVVAGKP